jgi:2-iminobutanoate/2-iminopropanoate deaminase
MQTVNTSHAPAAIGPYSQAVLHGDFIFVSGQLGIHPETGEMPYTFEEQAYLVFANLRAILEEAGLGFANVVKVSVFLKDMSKFSALNEIYAQHFSAPYPAREAYEVARLPKDGLLEISVIAAR